MDYSATFVYISPRGHALLEDIRASDRTLVVDHLWCHATPFIRAGVRPSSRIVFSALVGRYRRKDDTVDYCLSGVRQVRPIDIAAI
jgi:hypothetical protein